jgi:hypothetical protein
MTVLPEQIIHTNMEAGTRYVQMNFTIITDSVINDREYDKIKNMIIDELEKLKK